MATPTNFSTSYEDVYDLFGGQDATNNLITSFKGMGLDDATIASVFAPYRPATTSVAAPTPTYIAPTPTYVAPAPAPTPTYVAPAPALAPAPAPIANTVASAVTSPAPAPGGIAALLAPAPAPAPALAPTAYPTLISETYGTDGDLETRATTTDGTPVFLHDTDEGGWYRNPAVMETYTRFVDDKGNTYYAVQAPTFSTGLESHETPITGVMTEAQFRAFQGGSTMGGAIKGVLNSPVGSFALAALGPYGQLFNAAYQLNEGNTVGALTSGLNALGGFGWTDIAGVPVNTAKNIVSGLNAIDKGNWVGAFNAGANLMGGVPGEFRTVASLAGAATALSNNDASGFLNEIGNLTGSSDAKVAAAAIGMKNALESGNPTQLQAAFNNLNRAVTNSSSTTTPSAAPAPVGSPDSYASINDLLRDTLGTTLPGGFTSDANADVDRLIATLEGKVSEPTAGFALLSNAAQSGAGAVLRLVESPVGQQIVRDAANKSQYASTLVRDALIATGLFTAASIPRFLMGEGNLEKTTTPDSGLVSQIPTKYTPSSLSVAPAPAPALAPSIAPAPVRSVSPSPVNIDILDLLTNSGLVGDPYNLDFEDIIGFEPPVIDPRILPKAPSVAPTPEVAPAPAPDTVAPAPAPDTVAPAPAPEAAPAPNGPVRRIFDPKEPTTYPTPEEDPDFDWRNPSTWPPYNPAPTKAPAPAPSPDKVSPAPAPAPAPDKVSPAPAPAPAPDLAPAPAPDKVSPAPDFAPSPDEVAPAPAPSPIKIVPGPDTAPAPAPAPSPDKTTPAPAPAPSPDKTTPAPAPAPAPAPGPSFDPAPAPAPSPDKTTPAPAPAPSPVKITLAPSPTTSPSASPTGLSRSQAQQMAAAFGVPQLANVFYYGKEFGSKKQKLDKEGKLIEEEYEPLSVTEAGAELKDKLESVAEGGKTKDNSVMALLEQILGKGNDAVSEDELRNIVKGT